MWVKDKILLWQIYCVVLSKKRDEITCSYTKEWAGGNPVFAPVLNMVSKNLFFLAKSATLRHSYQSYPRKRKRHCIGTMHHHNSQSQLLNTHTHARTRAIVTRIRFYTHRRQRGWMDNKSPSPVAMTTVQTPTVKSFPGGVF